MPRGLLHFLLFFRTPSVLGFERFWHAVNRHFDPGPAQLNGQRLLQSLLSAKPKLKIGVKSCRQVADLSVSSEYPEEY